MLTYVLCFGLLISYKVNGWYMLLMPATALLSWYMTEMMKTAGGGKHAKRWLAAVIIVDLLPLIYFKYTNFLVGIFDNIFATNFSPMAIFLPVGLSFYTFQAISYSVDVYKQKVNYDVSLLEYCFYITFFPLLFAGPITRTDTLIPQLRTNKPVDEKLVNLGFWLIILGLLKKGLIADYIGVGIQYSETVWSSIFGSLDAGQIDLVVNEVSYTEERAEKYDFSIPYTFTQRAILVKADNDGINGLADISGKIASNDPTSSIGQFALDNGAELDPVGEMAQSISEVLNGRADLTINTTVAFADYLKQHPESEALVKIIVVTDPAPTGHVPVLKGEEQLLNAVNGALRKAQEDGTLSELSLKYFGIDITKE